MFFSLRLGINMPWRKGLGKSSSKLFTGLWTGELICSFGIAFGLACIWGCKWTKPLISLSKLKLLETFFNLFLDINYERRRKNGEKEETWVNLIFPSTWGEFIGEMYNRNGNNSKIIPHNLCMILALCSLHIPCLIYNIETINLNS